MKFLAQNKNVQSGPYWSGVGFEFVEAWNFTLSSGYPNHVTVPNDTFGWAVHSGDVGASPVPLPATVFLLAPALG
jgi:hypothetical protein